MSPGGSTSMKAVNNEGDFVLFIVKEHGWFVVKVKLTVI